MEGTKPIEKATSEVSNNMELHVYRGKSKKEKLQKMEIRFSHFPSSMPLVSCQKTVDHKTRHFGLASEVVSGWSESSELMP